MNKKGFVAIVMAAALLVINAGAAMAFTFPEPDWGALLQERRNMEAEIDFELYTEGGVESAPYYGARLEPRGGTVIGMIAETSESFKPLGSYLTYIECSYQSDMYYPANNMIENDNVAAMIGYNLYSTSDINYNLVRQTLNTLASYNKPMFIRFAAEMNDGALGADPTAYVNMFRTVADMVHEYPNFAVVWSPIDLGALNRPFEYYYPGDQYVDWIGVSCYSFKYFQGNNNATDKEAAYFMTRDYAWPTVKLKPILKFMEENNIKKPVMISEGGVATNGKYGENYEEWNTPRLRNMLYNVAMKYPQVKMINYFNTFRSAEAERFNISEFPHAAEIFKEAAASGAYIREFGTNSEFVYQKAEAGETIKAKDGVVNLYTLAYMPKKPNISVNYWLDGNWYHSSSQSPYKCGINVNSLSDGMHTIEICAENQKKSYTFYKKGSSIRFNAEPENEEIGVMIDGVDITFDQPPVIVNDRTLVPMRRIFEILGAEVSWDDANYVVTAVKGDLTIVMGIGSNTMYVGDALKALDVPAQLVNSRTMVPARAIAESLGCDVQWDESQNKVIITTN